MGLELSHKESWTSGRGKELCCSIIAAGEVGGNVQWWKELLLLTMSEAIAGLYQLWDTPWFQGRTCPYGR